MRLAINVGNTNVAFAIIKETLHQIRRPTHMIIDEQTLQQDLLQWLRGLSVSIQEITECILVSVVPPKTDCIVNAVQSLFEQSPVIVTQALPLAVDFSIYPANKLGLDRKICCHAAFLKYHTPFIVIDMGTATTINVVNESAHFCGGVIVPGMYLGLQALHQNTALPAVALSDEAPLLGQNTEESMLSGALHGTSFLLEGYTQRIFQQLAFPCPVIVTGGNSSFLHPYMNPHWIHHPNLLLEGLFSIDLS